MRYGGRSPPEAQSFGAEKGSLVRACCHLNSRRLLVNSRCHQVPCSKKTLMQDSAISLIDKRRLMKFLQYCGSAVTAEEEAAAAEQLFGEAMSKRFKLNPDAQQFIWHAIAGVPPTATVGPQRLVAAAVHVGAHGLFRSTPCQAAVADSPPPLLRPLDVHQLLEGLEATRRFLTSIGRYGPSPFLSVMYGCGELSQAFCR